MRYTIGIDLGTTNCALAFIDTLQSSLPVQLFAIPQLTGIGKVDPLLTLPSFCYLVSPGEWPPGALKLAWKEELVSFVGQFAKTQGTRVPTRLIKSAKSWLCNAAANRHDKILPLEAADPSQRLSPVEASAKYLMHLRDAWNASMAKGSSVDELEEQEIILTVPASFDEVARTLTVEAARQAGFLHLTLIEEPQAAFYHWISQHEREWRSMFKVGDSVLVCDVGGGTTDFSLIEIKENEGELSFQRMAVGDHLLLGGDNIDASISHYLENKLREEGHPPLDPHQWLQLQSESRSAKEALLAPNVPRGETFPILLQGMGSKVIKESVKSAITQEEMKHFVLEGFFGVFDLEKSLQLRKSRGFRTMGLHYEDEPSITKHLAHFLQQAQYLDKGIDYILFNGGTLKPEIFRQAIIDAIKTWFPHKNVNSLGSVNLDFAVARGAAYYGKARRGLGVRIRGGLPRTYYLKIDIKDERGNISSQALTLLPRGSEEEVVFQSDQIFFLRPNTPVSFDVLTSHVRLHDKIGEIIPIDPLEMQPLPPIQTIIRFGRKQSLVEGNETLPIRLSIRLTQIGTIEMWLESLKTTHRWALEFQLRSATGHDPSLKSAPSSFRDETYEKSDLEEAKKTIELLFQPNSKLEPDEIMEVLEKQIALSRKEWGPSLLRELWPPLLKAAPKRKLSLNHEGRWWNMAGFFLRPGFGFPLDDFRMKELWKVILSDWKMSKASDILIQMWICFRRVAGGFGKGQQMQLASDLIENVFDKKTGKIELKRKGDLYIYSEKIRALAALERVDLSMKIRLGNAIAERIKSGSNSSYEFWALGRIGARELLYGSIGQVVPRETSSNWVEMLLQRSPSNNDQDLSLFLLKQLARKTSHRELNLSDSIIKKVFDQYPHEGLQDWLLKEHFLTANEQEQVFGDQLPAGLLLDILLHP